MSAVSAESPRGSADLSTSGSSTQASDEQPSNGSVGQADFGPNQWLVDELYQRYQADPGSVDQAWWSFFADYHPEPDPGGPQPAGQAPAQAAVVPATGAGSAPRGAAAPQAAPAVSSADDGQAARAGRSAADVATPPGGANGLGSAGPAATQPATQPGTTPRPAAASTGV